VVTKQYYLSSKPRQLAGFFVFAGLAQLAERLTCNQDVVGSKPATGTRLTLRLTSQEINADVRQGFIW
jgi:hypothetical protein